MELHDNTKKILCIGNEVLFETVTQKKQYRKTLTAALKTQCRVFGGERWHN